MKTIDRIRRGRKRPIYLVSTNPLQSLFKRRGRLMNLRSRPAIHRAMVAAEAEAWLASDEAAANDLLAEASDSGLARRRLGSLVLLGAPRLESLPFALDLFQSVAWAHDRKSWLPMDELIEVLNAADPDEFIVGGMVDQLMETLTIYRGDFSRLTVPLAIFKPTGKGVTINPADFEVIDSGIAVRLGSYEAASDAIFYECDGAYRKRIAGKRRAEDRSFPACVRRLRILRGLRQTDFAPLPARTVARIERGEVGKPHGKTLARLAERLRVTPEEIESY
jgi:hypothetical protein